MINLPIPLIDYIEQLDWSINSEQKYIYDPVRKKRVVAQPEEIVRQCILSYLLDTSAFSAQRISVEKTFRLGGNRRRIDICLYDQNAQPCVLIECKAPSLSISQSHADQIAMYNQVLNAPFLWLSNGRDNFMFSVHKQAVHPLDYNVLLDEARSIKFH